MHGSPTNIEGEVQRRYGAAAQAVEPALCCPSSAPDPQILALLPREIVETDYGCGDPSAWVQEGDSVLDLGSGSGKACYVCAHKVGPTGRVRGIDMNDDMLALARKHHAEVAQRFGFDNVSFHKARIQDLGLDLEAAGGWLAAHPATTVEDLAAFEQFCAEERRTRPVVPDGSIDIVISNCVLNLVGPQDKQRLFAEMHRALRRGGRAVISDIVSDEDPTPETLADPELWSGCIAGAWREDAFLAAFERAGFYGMEIVARSAEPWRVIDGVEYRSMTVRAFKGKEGPCLERHQAVIHRGPWSEVRDDDGHVFRRGERMAVCDKTFHLLTDPNGPYASSFEPVPPRVEVPLDQAQPFACRGATVRSPRETKGNDYRETRTSGGDVCPTSAGGCC